MFTATIYGHKITAATMPALKRKASTIANNRFNPFDVMTVTDGQHTATFYRNNRKYPNNIIERGEWR